ncbi:MAG: hypothetical protein IKE08_04470 [Clostridia bacterium]|nr:hypothetical protein [Clostridia bacterium]
MTDMDRELWREAFILYDSNHEMPDSEDAWVYFVRKTAAFASAHPGSSLARALALALIDAVEGEAKARKKPPVQTSFLESL